MKRTVALLAFIAVLVATALPALAAFQANLGPATSNFPNQGVGGGSFGVALTGTIPGGLTFGPWTGQTWQEYYSPHATLSDIPWGRTFCVEDVFFTPGVWYTATVDPNVIYGSQGQLVNLTMGTRTAFANYALGNINPGLNGNLNRAMQAYFWDQQHVGAPSQNWTPAYWFNQLNPGEQNYYTNTVAALGLTGFESSVKVLNLWEGAAYTTDKQSQLVLVVPVPAAALLGVIGLGLVGWAKRRLA